MSEPTFEGVPGVVKYQLIMRERMENSSRLRKVLKKGTAIRVLRQGTAADGGKRALVTHDPPIEDHKGRVEGWVMWSDKGEDFIELLESDAMVPGGDGKAVADIVQSAMPRSNLRRGAATIVDMFDGFDDSFDTDKIAGTARPDMDSREAKLAARFARGAHTTASAAIAEGAKVAEVPSSSALGDVLRVADIGSTPRGVHGAGHDNPTPRTTQKLSAAAAGSTIESRERRVRI